LKFLIRLQVLVRNDQLFAGGGPDPRGFQPDMFYGSRQVVEDDEIAHDKGLVEHNGKGGEQVAEDILRRQSNGDPTDSQTGDQGIDIDTQVVKRQ